MASRVDTRMGLCHALEGPCYIVCLIMLFICTKFCQSISKGFRVTDLDNKVDAWMVANVD